MLGDDDPSAPRVQLIEGPVHVEGLVGDQPAEVDAFGQRSHAQGVEAVARAAARSSPGCRARRSGRRSWCSSRRASGLWPGPSSPIAPCPWRWTLTMLPSIIAYSRSGSPDIASNMRLKTSALTQCRNRLNTVFHLPNTSGKVPPLAAGARDPQNRLEEKPRVSASAPRVPRFAQTMRLDPKPLRVRQHQSRLQMLPFGSLNSEPARSGNPESQLTL